MILFKHSIKHKFKQKKKKKTADLFGGLFGFSLMTKQHTIKGTVNIRA